MLAYVKKIQICPWWRRTVGWQDLSSFLLNLGTCFSLFFDWEVHIFSPRHAWPSLKKFMHVFKTITEAVDNFLNRLFAVMHVLFDIRSSPASNFVFHGFDNNPQHAGMAGSYSAIITVLQCTHTLIEIVLSIIDSSE